MLDHDTHCVTKTSGLCGMTGPEVCIEFGGSGMPKSSKILNWLPYRGRGCKAWSISGERDSVGCLGPVETELQPVIRGWRLARLSRLDIIRTTCLNSGEPFMAAIVR